MKIRRYSYRSQLRMRSWTYRVQYYSHRIYDHDNRRFRRIDLHLGRKSWHIFIYSEGS